MAFRLCIRSPSQVVLDGPPGGVGERVIEHVERLGPALDDELEAGAGAVVPDGDAEAVGLLTPEERDLDPVARAVSQLAPLDPVFDSRRTHASKLEPRLLGRIGGLASPLPVIHRRETPGYDSPSMLLGRSAECAALDRLLEGGRAGRSGALVLRGEPGVGKTALLGYAAEKAKGLRVLRATGIETESELAFAALHQLVGRELDGLDRLPTPQAAALSGALGLSPGQGGDPFLTSLGLLSLLADLAEEASVLCLVDDAQWLDEPSASALLFTARRIEAEGIVMLFTVREGEERGFDAEGLPSLVVTGLDEHAARELLDQRVGNGLAPTVREQLVAETAGNALALVELPSALTQEQLRGDEPLAQPLPVAAGLEVAYLTRLRRLPQETQSLLLFAAAEDSGELAAILRAAATQKLDGRALEPAERDRLVNVTDGRLVFRHPLVRSAIYQGATFAQRQQVHTALAEAQDNSNGDRRAWHRAASAEGPDEEIARDLEASADRATQRGGHAAAAAALQKAAALSQDDRHRTLRLLAAADAAWLGGKTERARALVAEAARHAPSDLKVEVTKLQGRIDVRSGVFEDASNALIAAAQGLAKTDPATAIRLLTEAEDATFWTGNLGMIVQIGELAEEIAAASDAPDQFLVLMLVGLRRGFAEGTAAGAPLLREALELAKTSTDIDSLLMAGRIGAFLGDNAAGAIIMPRAVRLARESGAVGVLPRVLAAVAWGDFRHGRYPSARMNASEALRLARETGQEPGLALSVLALAAGAQGRDDECKAFAHEAMERAQERRASLLQSQGSWALGLLELAHGRYEESARVLELGMGRDGAFAHPALARHMIPDYVEAAVRAGRRDGLEETVAEYELWARSSNQPWTLALLAGCEALISQGDDVEGGFHEALDLLPTAERPFEYARTELLLGEHLRRNRKRREAREHLRAAMVTFEQLGAGPWEERARSELRATGETARKRDPSTLGDLTPQELQIARLVASGARNREVAAQLFLSPRTIDYHLRKVFMKLGISSRAELAKMELAGAVS
jgi:DNA-binding CsgD family transcriptional regulator